MCYENWRVPVEYKRTVVFYGLDHIELYKRFLTKQTQLVAIEKKYINDPKRQIAGILMSEAPRIIMNPAKA